MSKCLNSTRKSIISSLAEFIETYSSEIEEQEVFRFAQELSVISSFDCNGTAENENLLFESDNKRVLQLLLAGSDELNIKSYKGLIDLIYIDPPYNSNGDYNVRTRVFHQGKEYKFNQFGYTDKWCSGTIDYLKMLYVRLSLMRELLSENGSIFVHVDFHASSYVRLLLDEIFGSECMRNEIIWCYRQGGRSSKTFSHKHDTIFWYSKSPCEWIFNADSVRIPYVGTGGYQNSGNGVTINGKVYKPNEKGKIPEDWWDIPALPPMSSERNGFSTQKPEALLERIIQACSNEDSIVADFFCGSGTTLEVAQKLNRKWIGSDFGKRAIQMTQKRLLSNQTFLFKHISDSKLDKCYFNISILRNKKSSVEDFLKIDIVGINFNDFDTLNKIDKEDLSSIDPIEFIDMICIDTSYNSIVFRPQKIIVKKHRQKSIDKNELCVSVDSKSKMQISVLIIDIFGRYSYKILNV